MKRKRKETNLALNFNKRNEQIEPKEIKKDEILLQISFSHIRKLSKQMEFIFLGSQFLSCVKDSVYCLHDSNEERSHRKSGYFFIENVFYDDLRSNDNIPYSQYSSFFFFFNFFYYLN
jgi:hypothetical protein